MKAAEIKVGHVYTAKVSGKLTKVRVDTIRDAWQGYRGKYYDVTNLTTGRRITFRSAQRFRRETK